jgi:hypothetical protein
VTVSFYDRRLDPANCRAHVFATQSIDNGATWSANVQLTSVDSDFSGNGNGPGDYSSAAPFRVATMALQGVYPLFAQHRSGADFEVYTAPVN